MTGPAEETLVRLLYWAVAVLAAVLVGVWLYWLSQRSSQAQFRGAAEDLGAAARQRQRATVGLAPAIAQELKVLPGNEQQRQQAAASVSQLVSGLIDEQVAAAKQELKSHHEKLVEETRRNEVILQRKYQDALVEKKQTSAVLESIAEGLVVVNTKGDVVMMNPAAERLLGVKQGERIGRPLLENLKDEQLVSLVRQTSEGQRDIVLTAQQEATKRVLRASNAMIADENGATVGMVAVLSDVTKQREVEELKSEFVSKVSHELRTPLVAMQHSLAVVTDKIVGPLTEEQDKFLGITQRNLERLNQLISDLLDLSKLEARKMELKIEAGPIGPVIQTVSESLSAWAQAKAITIVRRLPEGLPAVLLDQARISQVLTNLIGNAIKFTPRQGRITVEAKPAENGAALEIGVADTGVGISKEDLAKLFNKFQQVGERTASDIGGTGLGLVIAKEIVELHRGRIWAESEANQGARFAFTLPVAADAATPR